MVFTTFLKIQDYQLTSDAVRFINYEGPKFTYGNKLLGKELLFKAQGLLTQKGIVEQEISIGEYQKTTTIFLLEDSPLPYDPFAAVFYMLSRYEEYLPHLRDEHDRFPISQSLAHQYGFLHQAVVDRWCLQLKEILLQHFQELVFGKREYRFIPTYDIDNAYAFKQKGILRSFAAMARNIFTLNFAVFKTQLMVLLGRQKDPYDTYYFQLNLQKKYKLKPIYFFLLGDYGHHDKNLSHENGHFQSLVKSLADYAQLGIHPSYASNFKKEKLKREIKRLERIIKRDVLKSRQHFLKLTFPETYRSLIEADIQEDYTMGYAEEIGFRAGSCTPFTFYDLDEELECKLTIYPFQFMESTLKYYLKLSSRNVMDDIKPIIDEVKAVDGLLISLWHNESLGNDPKWEGWNKVYEEMLAYALH